MSASIIDRGRGPEIAGTRITVYDIWDYARQNWHRDAIASTLRLSSAQVFAALEYIEQHKDEVLSEYDRMVERDRRGILPNSRPSSTRFTRNGRPSWLSVPQITWSRRMIRILADNNAEGHVELLLRILSKEPWSEIWNEVEATLVTFEDIGLDRDSSDAELWRTCQREQVVLITNNRNAHGPKSLEAVVRDENRPSSLPVFTLASADRLRTNREYAERTAGRLLEYLAYFEEIRGAGRIYLP